MTFDPDRPNAHAEARESAIVGQITAKMPPRIAPAILALQAELSEVEAQLHAILRLPLDEGGERCLLVVEEAYGRHERMARDLGVQDGDDRASEWLEGRFAVCGTCTIGPSRACARCARGEPHPGEACDDPRRNRCCRGITFLATLRARALGGAEADAIREDMGLMSEKQVVAK